MIICSRKSVAVVLIGLYSVHRHCEHLTICHMSDACSKCHLAHASDMP